MHPALARQRNLPRYVALRPWHTGICRTVFKDGLRNAVVLAVIDDAERYAIEHRGGDVIDGKRYCWIDPAKWASTGLNEGQRHRAVTALKEAGILEVEYRYFHAAGKALKHGRYRLNSEIVGFLIEAWEASELFEETTHEPADGAVQEPADETVLEPANARHSEPADSRHVMISKRSLENDHRDSRFEPPSAVPPPSRQDSFETFWQAYPKRGGVKPGKTKAEQQWMNSLNAADREAAIASLPTYIAAIKARACGTKDAFRWLRERLWEDYGPDVKPESLDLERRDIKTTTVPFEQSEFSRKRTTLPVWFWDGAENHSSSTDLTEAYTEGAQRLGLTLAEACSIGGRDPVTFEKLA